MSNNMEINLNSDTIVDWFYKNLTNLSTIKEGCKIYVNSENIIIVEEPYMFQGLWRYYNNVKRTDAINIINKLFENIERYYNSLYIKTCMIKNKQKIMSIPETIVKEFKDIIEKIEVSKEGIINLSKTYKDDSVTIAELEKISTYINLIITNFTKLYSIN